MIIDDLGLSKVERDKLEKILLDFDEQWSPEALSNQLADLILEPDGFCSVALQELIKVDLHRHWGQGSERSVDDYQSILESIGVEEIPAQLILSEFLARHAAGKSPKAKEFRERFPEQFDEFRNLFEAEKSRRTGLGKTQASISTDSGKAAIDTKTEAHVDLNSLPENFGRYKILRRLGAGAMGAVYLALDTQLDRQVALKTPTFGGASNEELVQRFYREARAAANLRHPNICPVFDVGQIDGRHYITMAFIEGRPLSDYIGGIKPLEQKALAGIVRKLALALADAHAAGVIHRDLKPANIMVDQKRQPLVMDFGLARREDEMQSRMTQSGTIMGTPAYMSPEQVTGKLDEIGTQADIYSLGIILYELLTGRLPFEGSVAAVIGQILTKQPTPPSEIRKDTDPALQATCLKMIAKQQTDRYASMNEVAVDLAEYVKGNQPAVGVALPQVADPLDDLPLADVVAESALPQPTQAAKFSPRKKSASFWKNKNGRYALIGAAIVGLMLIALSVTLIFRTPYGTIRVETFGDLSGLEVLVDGDVISLSESEKAQAKEHTLALKLDGTQLKLDPNTNQFVVTQNGTEHRLSVMIGDLQLSSKTFTITKNDVTVLKIELLENVEALASNTESDRSAEIQKDPVQPAEGFVSLFNGASLEGWVQKGGQANYRIEDGTIVGQAAPDTPNSFLCTEEEFDDFELEFEFKCDDGLNSGVQFRSAVYDKATTVTINGANKTIPAGRVHGYQFEIDSEASNRMWSGGVFDEGRTGWLFPGECGGDEEAFTRQGRRIFKREQWNSVRILCQGDHIQTWLNNELRADFRDDLAPGGFLGLQVHRVGNRNESLGEVHWRNIRIKSLQPNITEAKPKLFSGDLAGTTWSVTDSDQQQYEFFFRSNGVLHYDAGRGRRTNGTWTRIGDKITIKTNGGYSNIDGTFNENGMSGKGISRDGDIWTWEARLQSDR